MTQIAWADNESFGSHQTVIFDRYSAACHWIVTRWFEALKKPEETYFVALIYARQSLFINFLDI
jgi:hypothetical protein